MASKGRKCIENAVFGANLSPACRDIINRIRNNDPTLTQVTLWAENAGGFSDEGWELLGRYITNNTYLTYLNLTALELGALTDSKMSILFNNLTGSSSLKGLYLSLIEFGLSTLQSIVHFLKSCTKLNVLGLSCNHNINTDWFRVILEAIDGSSVEVLGLSDCRITDITALVTFNLPHLKNISLGANDINSVPSLESCTSLEKLYLDGNEIGNEGCKGIAMLLANNSSSLRILSLYDNHINDEGAEIIASSLTHNTRLKILSLSDNDITERGWGAFLKLLNDVSSIERTYKSNHTLSAISFSHTLLTPGSKIVRKHVDSALHINWHNQGNSHAAGSAKIIATQLNSTTRRELCQLQGIEFSYSAMFGNIDPVLLPELIALSSSEHGQNELYRIVVGTGPDLLSLANREKCQRSQKEQLRPGKHGYVPL